MTNMPQQKSVNNRNLFGPIGLLVGFILAFLIVQIGGGAITWALVVPISFGVGAAVDALLRRNLALGE